VISVVIPVYNERESLPVLHAEIEAVAGQHRLDLEIVFVDDGSNDGSWRSIKELASKHANVHGIRFRRNFGKAAALAAGFHEAKGDRIVTLDADLQDDPAEIPRFLEMLEHGGVTRAEQEAKGVGSPARPSPPAQGVPPGDDDLAGAYDVVSGWKRVRLDPWHKVGPSRVFNAMVSWLTGVRLHDHNCGMKCYRAEVCKEVHLYGELHRFIPVLAAARGFRVGELAINHRPRRFGRSKYGVRRFVKGFLDLLTVKFLTGFGRRPQHLLGSIGLFSFVLGGAGMIYLGVTWVINWFFIEGSRPFAPLHQRPLLIYSVAALLLGAQMMSIGFLAELITAYHGRDSDSYSIADRTSHEYHT
jgi:glycosyltransferase involved in cell wall biosynthesis